MMTVLMMMRRVLARVLARLPGDEMKSPAIQVRHAESLAALPIARLVDATSFADLVLLSTCFYRLFFVMASKVWERRRYL